MKIPNPNNPIYVQKNNGFRDRSANIAGSWNCDFSSQPGSILPSPRLIQGTNTSDEANLEQAGAFVAWDAVYWCTSEGGAYQGAADGDFNLLDTTIDRDPGTSSYQSPDTNNSDMVVFDGAVILSLTSEVTRRDDLSNAWQDDWLGGLTGGGNLSSSNPHPLEALQFTNVLAIGDGNKIHTVQGSGSYTATMNKLTLEASQYVKWIRSGSTRVWIGTTYAGRGDGQGLIYEWDGGDTLTTKAHKVNAYGALSAVVLNDVLYVVNSNAEVQRLDAGGLRTVAKFPIVNGTKRLDQWDSDFVPTNLHQRGMAAQNGRVLILLSSELDGSKGQYFRYFPSGVWEFDPETGSLTHKYSVTTDKTGSKDFGQWAIPESADASPGALVATKDDRDHSVLLGAGYWSDDGSTDNPAIYVDDITGTTKRRARVWYQSAYAVSDTAYYNKVVLKYRKMKNSDDKILVKYRTAPDAAYPLQADVTWSSTTEFTSTESTLASAKVGDEVFVLCANGGGSSAHISAITESGGTYTVSLDDTIYGVSASDTGIVAIEDFKLLDSFNDQVHTERTIRIPAESATRLELLVELRGEGGDSPILEEVDIVETTRS